MNDNMNAAWTGTNPIVPAASSGAARSSAKNLSEGQILESTVFVKNKPVETIVVAKENGKIVSK